jgi:trimeric autotransporter adhesin
LRHRRFTFRLFSQFCPAFAARRTRQFPHRPPLASFTAGCPAPTGLSERASARYIRLYWTPPLAPDGSNLGVRVRWRQAGQSWANVTVQRTGQAEVLISTNIVPEQVFEWQLATLCTEGDIIYSAVRSFTAQCEAPVAASTTQLPSSSGCFVSWQSTEPNLGNNSTVRWRINGSGAAWTSEGANLFGSNHFISNLAANTTYEWQAGISCHNNTIAWGLSSTFTTLCEPVEITPQTPKSTWIELTWPKRSGATYQLDLREAGTTTWPSSRTVNTGSPYLDIAPGPVRYRISDLQPGTAYEVRMKMLCAGGASSAYSSIASFTTTTISCTAVPTDAVVASATFDKAVYQWTAPPNATGYAVRFSWSGPLQLVDGAGNTAYTRSVSRQNTPYPTINWQVRATCANGDTSLFTPLYSHMMPCVAPVNLTALTTATTAQLRWEYLSGGNYTLQWRAVGGSWTTVPNLTATNYTLTGLTAGQAYEWQLATQCPNGGSLTAYTPVQPFTADCVPTRDLWTNAQTTSGLRINWASLGGTTYTIRWRVSGTTTWLGSTTATGGFYNITGLSPGIDYVVQVGTPCLNTSVVWSAGVAGSTNCGTVAGISSVTATTTTARLNWSSTGLPNYME